MLGYSRDELIGQTPFLFDCDFTPEQDDELQRLLVAGNQVTSSLDIDAKDGTVHASGDSLAAYRISGAQYSIVLGSRFVGIARSRWHREDRDRLWNHSPDLLLIANSAGVIQNVNPTWRKLLKWPG